VEGAEAKINRGSDSPATVDAVQEKGPEESGAESCTTVVAGNITPTVVAGNITLHVLHI